MLLTQFEAQIQQYHPQQRQFLIGFSGGLDSTALLHLFFKLRQKRPHLQLRAIHIHHGLSPNADEWSQHCQQVCTQLDIPLQIQKVRVQTEKGIEAGAREARYHAISQHLLAQEVLVTAHHQQDQTETFFLALKRGSGVAGLAAMPISSSLYGVPIFRPLLPFTRQTLQEYAQQAGLTWIEDESNEDNRYERNFLRNQILPNLRQRWQHFDQAVQRSAQHCFEQQQLLNELLAPDFAQHFNQTDRTFHLQSFEHHSAQKQKALLRLWFTHCGIAMPSTQQLSQIQQNVIAAAQDRNPQFQLGEIMLRRYQNKLYFTPHFADLRPIRIDLQIGDQITLPDNLGSLSIQTDGEQLNITWHKSPNPVTCQLPLPQIPMQLRFAYSGKVRLTPQAKNQDIKKIWQQLNIPVWQRNRIPLIFYGNTLQTALGAFVCHCHKN